MSPEFESRLVHNNRVSKDHLVEIEVRLNGIVAIVHFSVVTGYKCRPTAR